MECLQLRVKDIDFDRKIIVVREGKGTEGSRGHASRTRPPRIARADCPCSLDLMEDRAHNVPGVWLPDALSQISRASESWAWHRVFPSSTLSIDPPIKIRRRHHQYEQTVGRAIARQRRAPGFQKVSGTRSDARLQRICLSQELIFGVSRSCLAIAMSARRLRGLEVEHRVGLVSARLFLLRLLVFTVSVRTAATDLAPDTGTVLSADVRATVSTAKLNIRPGCRHLRLSHVARYSAALA